MKSRAGSHFGRGPRFGRAYAEAHADWALLTEHYCGVLDRVARSKRPCEKSRSGSKRPLYPLAIGWKARHTAGPARKRHAVRSASECCACLVVAGTDVR